MAALNSSIPFSCLLIYAFLLLCPLCSVKKGYGVEGKEATNNFHHLKVSSLLGLNVCNQTLRGIKKGSALEVLHKYGPCIQLQGEKPKNTRSEIEFLIQDQRRVNSIHHRLSKNPSGDGIFSEMQTKVQARSGLALGTGNYVVTVGLGTPTKEFTLEFDTGSDITWTQCEPCLISCYPQKEQIFNPTNSTSYKNVSCSSASCNLLPKGQRGCSSSACVYGIQYVDGSYTIGFLATETLTISSSDVFMNFLFGCGQDNSGIFGQAAGLLGLSPDKLSLPSQTAEKYQKLFSYCLPSTPSSTGFLNFGSQVSQTANFTPISRANPSFYGIDITGISVADRELPIDASIFSTSGAVIDSGAVITRLPPTAYSALKAAFQEMMKNYSTTEGNGLFDTCYDFSNFSNETITFPSISLSFKGGVVFDIDASGILYPANGLKKVCLAFAANSDDSEVAIFGNFQQKTYEVVYDDGKGMIGFSPGGCS